MGKKPIGFLNPLLYTAAKTIPHAFYDVTEGNNSYDCCPGFDAYKVISKQNSIDVFVFQEQNHNLVLSCDRVGIQ
jgi:hypothetical protein